MLKKINGFATALNKKLALLSVAVAVLALTVPQFWVGLSGQVSVDLSWIPFLGNHFPRLGFVNLLLGIIMLGMGMTLTTRDFALILARPRDVLIGVLSQFVYMSAFGWLMARLVILTGLGGPEVAAQVGVGLVLLGTVPGGTASNVMTFLAKGDVPLSITLTMCSTLLAPVLTPALTKVLAGQWVEVNFWGMFFSIVVVVLLPVLLGLAVHTALGERMDKYNKILVLISTLGILMVIGLVVGPNQKAIVENGLGLVAVTALAVLVHHVLGLIAGWYTARFFQFSETKSRALSMEVGLQNSGLASTLAASSFAGTLAILPCALATIIHQVVGPIAANMYAARDSKPMVSVQDPLPEQAAPTSAAAETV